MYHRLPWREPDVPYRLGVLYEDDHLVSIVCVTVLVQFHRLFFCAGEWLFYYRRSGHIMRKYNLVMYVSSSRSLYLVSNGLDGRCFTDRRQQTFRLASPTRRAFPAKDCVEAAGMAHCRERETFACLRGFEFVF